MGRESIMSTPSLPYRERDLSQYVRKAMSTLPVVVITGLRQAGKTTFLRQDPLFADRKYLSLDDLTVLEAARSDPDALVGGNEPLLIDEAQRVPELFLALKRAVDRDRTPGRFVVSGSANLSLLEGITESLAGRSLYLMLHPFTRRERLQLKTEPFLPQLFDDPGAAVAGLTTRDQCAVGGAIAGDEVLAGGMPPVVTLDIDRSLWFLGYEQTYIERDVRQISQIPDLVPFRNVLQISALRTAQLLNLSSLAQDARISPTTATRYMDLLETSFIIERLPPYLRSRAQRLRKTPKLFFADSGLAAHLCSVEDISPRGAQPMRGHLWETWVFENLRGIVDSFLPGAEIGYWSIQGRTEVDFVVSYKRRAIAIEVKSASRFGKSDLKGLRSFVDQTPQARAGILAYNGEQALDLGNQLFAVPLAWLLS